MNQLNEKMGFVAKARPNTSKPASRIVDSRAITLADCEEYQSEHGLVEVH